MSICPKNKSSKSRRDKRRANWKRSAQGILNSISSHPLKPETLPSFFLFLN